MADSPAVQDPTLTATLRSKSGPNKFGWYRTRVFVDFTCDEGSAPLTEPCPATVEFDRNRPDQFVERTIRATDGGSATARVSGINVDRSIPSMRLALKGEVRNGVLRHVLRCKGSDYSSGIAKCQVRRRGVYKRFNRDGKRIENGRYEIIAKDRAGNRNARRGKYQRIFFQRLE